MAEEAKSQKSKGEEDYYDQKRHITEQVRMRFARFGNETLSIVLAYALQPKRMPTLLDRIEVRISAQDIGAQLDAISAYIAEKGPMKFVQRAMQRKAEELGAIKLDDSEEPTASPAISKPDVPATPTVAPTTPAPGQIETPTYQGPDRRSGSERRSKPDRRDKIDAINKNKRYGGDRRKSAQGRRKEDKTRSPFWWRQLRVNPRKSVSK